MKNKNKIYSNKVERASGDLLSYFIVHNIVSSLLFFILTFSMGIYTSQNVIYGLNGIEIILYIFSSAFWSIAFQAIAILFLCSIIGRISGFYLMRAYYNYYKNRATKRWGELNKGINKIGLRWVLTTIFTAIIYCVGVIYLLANIIFNETSVLSLLIIYILVKVTVYLFVRWIVGSKA